MRAEIEKSKAEIAENYHVTFDYYLEQINICENWCKEAEALIESKGSQDEALRLINKILEDPEGDMKLVDMDLFGRVKAYAFSKIFDMCLLDKTKKSAREFIKHVKRSLPKDLPIPPALIEHEL